MELSGQAHTWPWGRYRHKWLQPPLSLPHVLLPATSPTRVVIGYYYICSSIYRAYISSVRAEIWDGETPTELSGAGHSNNVHEIGQSIMDDNLASTCVLVETLNGLVVPVGDIDMVAKLNTQYNSVNILMWEFLQLIMYQANALCFYLKINIRKCNERQSS